MQRTTRTAFGASALVMAFSLAGCAVLAVQLHQRPVGLNLALLPMPTWMRSAVRSATTTALHDHSRAGIVASMRVVVSGTHASGKSTLISDFALRHPEFAVLPDPFELVNEADDAPSAALFASQLRIAADRLRREEHGEHVIAERGPLDFLAYLLALAQLTGNALDAPSLEQAIGRTTEAMTTVDLLVVLPLTASDPIHIGADEHLELRDAMNNALLELIDDPDIIGAHLVIAEITGTPETRLAALEALTGAATRDDLGPSH